MIEQFWGCSIFVGKQCVLSLTALLFHWLCLDLIRLPHSECGILPGSCYAEKPLTQKVRILMIYREVMTKFIQLQILLTGPKGSC